MDKCQFKEFVWSYTGEPTNPCTHKPYNMYVNDKYCKKHLFVNKPELIHYCQSGDNIFRRSKDCMVLVEKGKKLCTYCRSQNGCKIKGCGKLGGRPYNMCDKHHPMTTCSNTKCDNTFKSRGRYGGDCCDECRVRGYLCIDCNYLYKKNSKFIQQKIGYYRCLFCASKNRCGNVSNLISDNINRKAVLTILHLHKSTYTQYFLRLSNKYHSIGDIITAALRVYDNVTERGFHPTLKLLDYDQGLCDEWINSYGNDGTIELCMRVALLPKDMFNLIMSLL